VRPSTATSCRRTSSDVLGGGRATQQQEEAEHILKDQLQQALRHDGDHARLLAIINHCWSAACSILEPRSPISKGQCRVSSQISLVRAHWISRVAASL
jgi:hypothetical protein